MRWRKNRRVSLRRPNGEGMFPEHRSVMWSKVREGTIKFHCESLETAYMGRIFDHNILQIIP
jgi:hypothetical protein